MVGRTSAFYTDGVNLLYVFSYSHQCRHRTERFSHEVCVQTGDDYSYTTVCKGLYDLYDGIVKELSLIDADYFHIV